MKYLPLLFLSILLFTIGCKKDKNDQEPSHNNISAMQQALDGKTIEFSNQWYRAVDSGSVEFYGFQGVLDSIAFYRSSLNNTTNLIQYQPTLLDTITHRAIFTSGVINFLSPNKINFSINTGGAYFTNTWYYTNSFDNSKYWVFSFYAADFSSEDTSESSIISRFSSTASIGSFIDFVQGLNKKRKYSWVDVGTTNAYPQWQQLYIPKNPQDSVFILNMANAFYHPIGGAAEGYYLGNVDGNTPWNNSLSLNTSYTNKLPHSNNHYRRFYTEDDWPNSFSGEYSTGIIK